MSATQTRITSLCSRKRFILHHNSVDTNITVISHDSRQNIRWLQQEWRNTCRLCACTLTEDWILDFGVGVVHVEQQLLEQELQVWAARVCVVVFPQRWEPCAQRLQRFEADVFTAVIHTLQQLWNTNRHAHESTYYLTDTSETMKLCNNNSYYTHWYASFDQDSLMKSGIHFSKQK